MLTLQQINTGIFTSSLFGVEPLKWSVSDLQLFLSSLELFIMFIDQKICWLELFTKFWVKNSEFLTCLEKSVLEEAADVSKTKLV